MPIPREESNVNNGLVPSAAIPSAAIQAQSDKIAALANMTARFVKLGLHRQDRGTCRDLAGMVNTGARGACRSRTRPASTEGRIASARRKARLAILAARWRLNARGYGGFGGKVQAPPFWERAALD
ncbi:MAG: hypothetical protein CR217_14670 [Beijerinckiaceae bacterium]|nr:MAG: hypothetical protein CR217_14670 [Beijerinckiaceae bacterium]